MATHQRNNPWGILIRLLTVSYFLVVHPVTSDSTKNDDLTSLTSRRYFKSGNVSIGGLFPVHTRSCTDSNLRPEYLGLAEAMVFAISEINKNPYLLPNITLGYDIYDTCLNKRLAMRSALEFVNLYNLASHSKDLLSAANSVQCHNAIVASPLRPVSAVIGTGSSSSSTVVANLLQVADIPLVSYAATSDKLSKTREFPTFFRTVPPDRFQSKAIVDIAKHFNWSYVSAIASDESYGRSGIEFFKTQAQRQGICIETEYYFPPEPDSGKNEIEGIVSELKKGERKSRVIILYCNKNKAKEVLREAARQGLSDRTWIASEAWVSDKTFEDLPNNVTAVMKGLMGVSFPNTVVKSFKKYMLGLNSSYVPNQWWKALWKSPIWEKEYNCKFNSDSSQSNSFTKQCPKFFQITEKIFPKFYDVKDVAVMDAVYAIAQAIDWTHGCKKINGHLPGDKCPITSPFTEPEDLLYYMPYINTSGSVSQISFDKNGDFSADYTIMNLKLIDGKRWRFGKVGSWNERRRTALEINDSDIFWNNSPGTLRESRVPTSVCSKTCKPGFYQTPPNECCWNCVVCPPNEISTDYGARNCTPCGTDHTRNKDGTECIKIPIIYLKLSDTSGIIVLLLTVVGIAATLFIAGVFIKYNSTPIVRAANRELSYLMLICIGLEYGSSVIFLWEPTPIVCGLYKSSFFVLSSTLVAVLGSKTYRIVNLFKTKMPNCERRKSLLRKYRHVWIVAGVELVVVLILLTWLVADSSEPHLNTTFNTEYYIKECRADSNTAGKSCHYLLMAILCALSFVSCFFAFKARKLPHNFNEAKYIAFALYVAMISWLTYYPVYLTIQGKYRDLISCAAAITTASGMLICMFVPKVYIILRYPDRNTSNYMKAQITDHTFRRSVAKDRARTLSTLSSESPRLHRKVRDSPRNTLTDSPTALLKNKVTSILSNRNLADSPPLSARNGRMNDTNL